jgi:hypothetical protein
MMVPAGKPAKFADFVGTKAPVGRGKAIRPAMSYKPVKTAEEALYGP